MGQGRKINHRADHKKSSKRQPGVNRWREGRGRSENESFPCLGSIPSPPPERGGTAGVGLERVAEPRDRKAGKEQLMSLPSLAWPQQDEPPPCGTATSLPPASSDSDSGCALEEYPEPPVDPVLPEVPVCFSTRSPQPASPDDRIRLRARALLQQLPPQDCDERYCLDLEEEERRQLRAFSARRRREALGQGLACPVPGPCHGCPCKKCGRRLNKGDPGISASRLGDQFWHPSCFSCHFCHQPLVDLIYFQQDGRIYCGRHHAELFRPRCASCDQLIFMEECIEAEGQRWHLEHFCCLECDVPLRGQRYVMKSGRPCCRTCFENFFAEPCQACGDPIGADSEEATHQGLHWHARAACFCCSLCRKPLRGQPFIAHHGRLFCSETCSLGQDASSTTSDSSDSAFASAPSPDSTPLSRAGSAGRTTPGMGSTSVPGGCRQRVEGAEAFLDQASLHPAFRSPEDCGATAKEQSEDAVHAGMLGPLARHSSSPQPSPEGPSGPRAPSHPVLGGPDPREPTGHGDPRFQAATSPAQYSPQPEDIDLQDITEEDDSWCPTCSSSSDSDSEEEGFFFGKPIPKPGMSSLGREPLGKAGSKMAKPRGSSKHCSVS
ncbi:prickle-like protein 4 isoform X2 [Cuculus canorus]|uniref:prickle-like protein 4 isoform X2 n=1 Tax=Cuculus canorus TaxID=55661 RepID=UPI0023AAF656|nr:prickle-like protein 4 isoform X2 [Cuculus canorus]